MKQIKSKNLIQIYQKEEELKRIMYQDPVRSFSWCGGPNIFAEQKVFGLWIL